LAKLRFCDTGLDRLYHVGQQRRRGRRV